jgi:hypothetical protein
MPQCAEVTAAGRFNRKPRSDKVCMSVSPLTSSKARGREAHRAIVRRVGCAYTKVSRGRSGSLLIFSSFISFIISLVAAALYVAVNNLEPNRSHASALKILIITLAVVAILAHLIG